MRVQFGMILAAAALVHSAAAEGELPVTSQPLSGISLWTVDRATYPVASVSEIAALLPVSIRPGETVTATSQRGVMATLESTSLASVLNAGGVWTLSNSAQGTALIGVPWEIYGDGGKLTSVSSEDFGADTTQTGPNRKTKKRMVLPVAWSGDNWLRAPSVAAKLTFASPSGTTTELDLTGSGATEFTFSEYGEWTVTLEMADGTSCASAITIETIGTKVVFR